MNRWVVFGFCFLLRIHQGSSQETSNEGTRFAIAFPPGRSVDGSLIMTARENTTVLVTYPLLINEIVFLVENETTYYSFDANLLRCTEGIEDKGILITATNPIVAHLGNSGGLSVNNPDVTILRPMPEASSDVFLVGYGNGSSDEYGPKSFYMIVSYEADTGVQVFMKEGDSHVLVNEFTLSNNQVYTEDANYDPSEENYLIDYTGGFVRASKPVAVYSGHGRALVPDTVPNSDARSLFESMPYQNDLGTEYITFPYHFGDNLSGYNVRVVSVSEDTSLTVPALGINVPLDTGSFYDLDYPLMRQGTPVRCSKPCIVAQYPNRSPSGDSPGEQYMDPCLIILIPKDAYSTNAWFATDPNHWTGGLSIITDFFPVSDLYLNDESLEDLDWGVAPEMAGFFATRGLDAGTYNLYTLDPDHKFAAYYYSSRSTSSTSNHYSFGYSVSYGAHRDEDAGNSTIIYGTDG